MAFWKQSLIVIVVLAAGLIGWVWLVPGAGQMLAGLGVPERIVAAISPAPETTGSTSGQGNTQRQGQAPVASGQSPSGASQAPGGRGFGGNAPMVVVRPVVSGKVNDRLSAIGTGEAYQSVTVTPQVAGPLKEVLIASGDHVEKDQVIARLNDEEQVIALSQARVDLRSAQEKAQVYQNLRSAVSRIDAFNAEIAVETAELAVNTAELNLKRREIVAPIAGVAGIVSVNAGDYVTTTTAIVTLDDRSNILVDYWVPERFAPIIDVGQPVQATAVARPAAVFDGVVEAIDNRIDETSRTLRIRARIENEDDDLRAGMAFAVSMRFDGETYPAVDPLAIQWDSGGSYVWRVVDGKADKVSVRIVQRNPDSVLVESGLREGDLVIVEGVQRVRDGGGVRVTGETTANETIRQEAANQ